MAADLMVDEVLDHSREDQVVQVAQAALEDLREGEGRQQLLARTVQQWRGRRSS